MDWFSKIFKRKETEEEKAEEPIKDTSEEEIIEEQ